jgi:hypothetical protein
MAHPRSFRILCAAATLLLALTACAQTADQPMTFGSSIAPLAGPWRFTPGDSPKRSGTLLYASPTFDDSTWSRMDLRPAPSAQDPGYGTPGYVPGWTAKGFPHLAGFAWYRLRIRVADSTQPLALKMPDHVDDAYQVFANGKLLGSLGDFSGSRVVCFRSRPTVVTLPPSAPDGTTVLAIRFYEEPWVAVEATAPDSGGMHESPILGLPSEVAYLRHQEVAARFLSVVPAVFVGLLMLIASVGAFWIWLLDRGDTTYVWLTGALVATAAGPIVTLVNLFTLQWSQDTGAVFINVLRYVCLLCWIFFWQHWFSLRTTAPVRILLIVATLGTIPIKIYTFWFGNSSTVQFELRAAQIAAFANGIFGVLLFVNLLRGARKDRTGALLALPPVLLLTFSVFELELLDWARIRTSFFPFGLQIGVGDVASLLLILVVGALVARRFIGSQVAQKLARRTIDQEFEQARELQQRVLIPELIESSIFAVETEYKPARAVGGDFFQVIAHPNGSLLVVVGDVSGKGMAAAMLVAVLVGAIRTCADETFAPDAILRTLNDRLLGRAGGHFATCLVAHLHPGGVLTLANAGHIPPFRNGAEIELPGSLPLGLVADAEYAVEGFQLHPNDRLTLLTDGVPEARNAAGHLLGFECLAELSLQSPQAIAQAAIDYGQDDDITIVSVTMLPAAHSLATAAIYASAQAPA